MYLLLKSLNFNLHPFPTADTNCVMKRDSIPEAIQHKPFRTDSWSCSPVGGDGDEVNSTPRAFAIENYVMKFTRWVSVGVQWMRSYIVVRKYVNMRHIGEL